MIKYFIGIILAISVVGYFYYKDTQTTITELRQLNGNYAVQTEEQYKTIEFLRETFDQQTASLLVMQERNQEAQQEITRYLSILREHDLTFLAASKPGLIESRVNNGTREVFDGIEADSLIINSGTGRVQ